MEGDMAHDISNCPNGRVTSGSIVILVSAVSIVANIIAVAKSGHSRIKKNTVISLRILCGTFIALATMTTSCTFLAMFTCSLDNTIACALQGALQRLMRVTAHLSLTMFFMNSLNQTMVHHPTRSVVKICQVVLTIAWIIAAAMSSLPLFASTSYRDYPSLFACDIADMRILVTSDSFVFCMPALAVLAISLYIIASETFRHRMSYAVTPGRVDIHSREDLQTTKRGAKAGVVISAAMFMDWIVRITAVLGTDISSKSLLTLSVFFMLINVLCVPSCLLLVSRLPAIQISFQNSHEGMGYTNPIPDSETRFNFPPLRADFNVNSVSSSTEVNIRAADLCLNQDVYRRGFQHIPSGRDLQNTPDGRDLQNTPDGRDLLNTPDGRDLQNTPDGRDLQNTPDGRDLQNTPDGSDLQNIPDGRDLQNIPDLQNTLCERVFHNTPPERDLQNTSSEVNADSVSSSLAPHPDLKRNSVSCMLSVGSWINNEQKEIVKSSRGQEQHHVQVLS